MRTKTIALMPGVQAQIAACSGHITSSLFIRQLDTDAVQVPFKIYAPDGVTVLADCSSGVNFVFDGPFAPDSVLGFIKIPDTAPISNFRLTFDSPTVANFVAGYVQGIPASGYKKL
jgi:hypothetical protein